MTYPETASITILRVPRGVAVPPNTATNIDVDALKARITALEAGHPLSGLTDVDLTGLVDGDVLIYDAGTATWLRGAPPNNAISLNGDAVTAIATTASSGLIAGDLLSSGIGVFFVDFGGTGTVDKAARSDHTHTPVLRTGPQTFAATGALSSGTRTLKTVNVTLADGITYDVEARMVCTVRNDGSAGVVNYGLRIGSSPSFPRTTTAVRNVGGVDAQHEWTFVRSDYNGGAITGTGATVAVVADVEFSSGDPTNVRHGWVEVTASPRR